jgi:hypothetical protein
MVEATLNAQEMKFFFFFFLIIGRKKKIMAIAGKLST